MLVNVTGLVWRGQELCSCSVFAPGPGAVWSRCDGCGLCVSISARSVDLGEVRVARLPNCRGGETVDFPLHLPGVVSSSWVVIDPSIVESALTAPGGRQASLAQLREAFDGKYLPGGFTGFRSAG